MKTILFIDASHSTSKASYDACMNLGFRALFIVDRKRFKGDTLLGIPAESVLSTNTDEYSSVVECIAARSDVEIAAVFSLTDRAMKCAILVGLSIGSATPDKALLYLLQKEVVSKIVAEFCPHTQAFLLSDAPTPGLYEMLSAYGRIAIKPSQGSASVGSFVVSTPEQLDRLQDLIEAESGGVQMAGFWLAQQYIDGEFFSLEGYVHNGICTFLGLTYRKRVGNTLTAAYFPGSRKIESNTESSAKSAVATLVERSGYRNGYFHSEFIADDNGTYLIDANFGRIAGGGIAQLIADHYELSLSRVMEHVIRLTLFNDLCENFPLSNAKEPSLGITYGVLHACTFERLVVPDSITSRHVSLVDPGDRVEEIGTNGSDWVGILMGRESSVLADIDKLQIRSACGALISPAW